MTRTHGTRGPALLEMRPHRLVLVALALIQTACSGDHNPTEPHSFSPESHTSAAQGCNAAACTLLASSSVFGYALANPDSVGNLLEVGRVTVQAHPGATLCLMLEADAAVLRGVSAGTKLVIEAAGHQVANVELTSLARPTVVYRLASLEPIEIRYLLTRNLTTASTGDVRLVQMLGGGQVLSSVRPWVAEGDGTPARYSTSESSTGVSCALSPPEFSCGGVTATVSPWYATAIWGSEFTSRPHTGPSVTITVAFDKPVSSFTVTVYDPDFSGNQVQAVDANGALIQAVSVPGDNTPGTLTMFVATVSGAGIRTVYLIPAPDDFITYGQASVTAAAPEFNVTCQAVQRGGVTTCTASDPNGGTVTVEEWRFTSPKVPVPIVESSNSLTWTGAAVVEGTVRATGSLNGEFATGTGALSVSSRNWSQDTVSYSQLEVPQADLELPPKPTNVGQLGAHASDVQISVDPAVWAEVESGPNRSLLYYKQVPVLAVSVIAINRIAMKQQSEFYNLQGNQRQGKWCSKADVEAFIPFVEEHEGLAPLGSPPPTGSHAGVLRQELNSRVPQNTEHVVAQGDLGTLTTLAEQAAGPAIAAAVQLSKDSWVQGGTVLPVDYPCDFKYFKK